MEALAVLQQAGTLAFPLLAPRLRETADGLELQWVDRIGLGPQARFAVETMATAVTSLANWLSGRRLLWRYDFAHAKPAYIEQYEVHLSGDCRFGAASDCVRISREALLQASGPRPLRAAACMLCRASSRRCPHSPANRAFAKC